jgi:hypothetical protein
MARCTTIGGQKGTIWFCSHAEPFHHSNVHEIKPLKLNVPKPNAPRRYPSADTETRPRFPGALFMSTGLYGAD